jgi:hypothetical protein
MNTNLLIFVFDGKNWLKETIVLIALMTIVSVLVSMFIPFPLSYPITIVVIILIVWFIRRRTSHVAYSSKG